MKLSFLLLLTGLSLLNPAIANPIAPGSDLTPSLFGRARSDIYNSEEDSDREDPDFRDPIPRPRLGSIAWMGQNARSIVTKIRTLPVPSWISDLPERALGLKNVVMFGVKYRVDPTRLYRVNRLGELQDPDHMSAKYMIDDLISVPHKEGDVWMIPASEDRPVSLAGELVYEPVYLSRKGAIEDFARAQAFLRTLDDESSRLSVKRSIEVLQTLDHPPGGSTATGSPQAAAAVFEQYLEMLDMVQAHIGALIAPVLNNFTAHTDNTLIHQMALSIYYDLTGSTVRLDGPFNYGMSFVGNASMISLDQGGNSTIVTNGTVSDARQVYTKLENIYTYMYVQAMTAANSTGLFAEQIYLASCLCTNETSVYPPGFETVSSSHNTQKTGKF